MFVGLLYGLVFRDVPNTQEKAQVVQSALFMGTIFNGMVTVALTIIKVRKCNATQCNQLTIIKARGTSRCREAAGLGAANAARGFARARPGAALGAKTERLRLSFPRRS